MTMPDWKHHAERLADEITHPQSRWRRPVATTPRHVFVPRWWRDGADEKSLGDGASDPERWMRIAYSNTSLVTRIVSRHADHAQPGDKADGRPTSSSTLPWLVVRMYQHAMVADTSRVLVVTGSGYGTALLCHRIGEKNVTSVDVDPYLVEAARDRLDGIGLHPDMAVCDITGALPGEYDRIVSTVSVPNVPVSWLKALNPGGRLVTTLADTGLVITADKTRDGGAIGQVPCEGAGFMVARHGEDYPSADTEEETGGEETTSPYPVVQVQQAWELWSMLSLTVPGIRHHFTEKDGQRTARMVHPDGSWARATGQRTGTATVRQGGPRRLWDELDRIRSRWLADGQLCAYGAHVRITPDGETTLTRSGWSATLPAA